MSAMKVAKTEFSHFNIFSTAFTHGIIFIFNSHNFHRSVQIVFLFLILSLYLKDFFSDNHY